MHRLNPRRPSRVPEWAAIVAAAAAALFLVFYGPPTSAGDVPDIAVEPGRAG